MAPRVVGVEVATLADRGPAATWLLCRQEHHRPTFERRAKYISVCRSGGGGSPCPP
jgi:hypothetical protein